MGIFSCNYNDCEKRAHSEVFFEDEEGIGKWCYLCFWHYIWLRFIKREKGNGYCKVSTDREAIEHIHEDIWDIQGDLGLIKEKLKIREKKVYEKEKPEEKGYS